MEIKRPEPHQPIPPEAKKVFTGIIYDVYQWPQKRFDESVVMYERLRRHDSVVIVAATPEGKILLMQEQQPGTDWYSAVPCGGVEPNEAPEAAAARELLEETGYIAEGIELWFAEQVEHRVDWALFVFIARGCTKAQPHLDEAGERTKVSEISFTDFLHAATKDDFQNINLGRKLLKAVLDPAEMTTLKKRLGIV
jgi:ADP-ribose pyrophosphatase YjhB (NUDIX family)